MSPAFRKYMVCIVYNIIKWKNGHIRWFVGGFCGYGRSVCVMGEWAVGFWIVGVTSFLKIYGLYGLKRQIVEISGDVTKAGRTDNQPTRKDRATQLLNRETLSFAINVT